MKHSFQTRPSGRPGPRPGFRVLTGLPGRSGHFLKKNQNNIVLIIHVLVYGYTWSLQLK